MRVIQAAWTSHLTSLIPVRFEGRNPNLLPALGFHTGDWEEKGIVGKDFSSVGFAVPQILLESGCRPCMHLCSLDLFIL